MLVYTLLFTLIGKDPANNKYVDMFFIWITYLARNARLEQSDKIAVLIDDPTCKYLESMEGFQALSSKLPFSILFSTIPQPDTITKGILTRFNYSNKMFNQTIHLFLDLDVLVVRPIRYLFEQLPENTIILFPEGIMSEKNYGGHFIQDDSMNGFSAGYFAFTKGEDIANLFTSIQDDCLKNEKDPFYTIDQPFFNLHIYKRIKENIGNFNIFTLPKQYLETNSATIRKETLFMNYCGDVGIGSSHLQKLFMKLCIDYLFTR